MAKLEHYFEQAQPLDQYINNMTDHKDNLLSIYQSLELPDQDERLDQIKQGPIDKVLMISEDWCGDAMMNNAILKYIVEQTDIEAKVFKRDDDTDLIDQYLTNGKSRSIPIYIFLNKQYEQVAVWGPRAKQVQAFVDKTKASLPDQEDPSFQDKKKEMLAIFTQRFKTDSTFWKDVYESILDKIAK
ncbi:thioredoxin family protein [Staphylococcus massiliensis]|uniref:Thioredoxin n=1 Tax=Staphylococcus massiliensis S46 TaxID=1229783 RepID=K9AE47_9STAP|nr:thioredoxin family protein [Staphylococcus massiliensis]EKU45604.1 hypothetical protein C273_11021 [Staphylococcus massiliensis S46]MCG3399908.1 thioredoxin family protein [Staphylococcus massiliensis]MCG3402627.1 thioredoxin family protein [Staphylococcus massiliensis]MCG3413095.1 thioredoxin family protein [Staphylococcus massiliensis]PNZ97937.1 thioredoxin family protein [Staphylococcus massiliensis CCUG 55927]